MTEVYHLHCIVRGPRGPYKVYLHRPTEDEHNFRALQRAHYEVAGRDILDGEYAAAKCDLLNSVVTLEQTGDKASVEVSVVVPDLTVDPDKEQLANDC